MSLCCDDSPWFIFVSSSCKPTSSHNFSLHHVFIALISLPMQPVQTPAGAFHCPIMHRYRIFIRKQNIKLTLLRKRFISFHENKDESVWRNCRVETAIVIFERAPPASPGREEELFLFMLNMTFCSCCFTKCDCAFWSQQQRLIFIFCLKSSCDITYTIQ